MVQTEKYNVNKKYLQIQSFLQYSSIYFKNII